jgi:hypothetical protein
MVDAAAPPPPGTLPSDNAGYLRQAYWEQRFETEGARRAQASSPLRGT